MQLVLGKRGDYAIRAVLDIAAHFGSRRKAREIAARMSIPQKYLSRILADLVRSGVLGATAGQEGGYELVNPPQDVTLLEVIEAVEGRTELRECLLRGTPCNSGGACSLHDPWVEAEEAMLARLRATTFADLASPARRRRMTPRAPSGDPAKPSVHRSPAAMSRTDRAMAEVPASEATRGR
ncbi:MAG: Rrf2 family transcriptional regulator [Dehalococcoidia bacterium]